MTTLAQRTFSSGEVSPSLYSRVDTTKYATGLRTCKNSMVLRYGGVSNRPGTEFISMVNSSDASSRLVPFIFSTTQTYVLEFGSSTMRVIKDGVLQSEPAKTISGVTQANPAVVTTAGVHGYTSGDHVSISGVIGMVELNNREFVITVLSTTTFSLIVKAETRFALDSSTYTAYASAGSSYKTYVVPTIYSATEVKEFKYIQSADVVTIVHPSHPPQELSRTGDISWSFGEINFAPLVDAPTLVTAANGPAGTIVHKYLVTSVDDQGNESLPGTSTGISITAFTNANPGVMTFSGIHGFVSGDTVKLATVDGMTEVDNKYFTVDVLTTTTAALRNVDTTDFGTFVPTGACQLTYATPAAAKGTPTTATPIDVTWTAPTNTDVIEYRVYKEGSGAYELLGITTGLAFEDIGQSSDGAITNPRARYPFLGANNYPSTVSYIQQRLVFANTNNDTEKIFMSKTSDFKNFSTSTPLQSDDAITFQMVGRQVNSVENLLDLGSFVILTSGGEWNAAGNEAGIVEPTAINTKQYSYNGSGSLQPIIIDGSAIYQQARGSTIRDLSFDFAVDGYRGNDLTIFSSHLFDNYTITDWAFQQIPHSTLWVIRSDGALLGMTFVRNQEIRAWHIHELGGECESVAVVPEGNEDVLYVQVKRTIDGNVVRFTEKLTSRQIDDVRDNKFMDACLSYDGRNTDAALVVTLSGAGDWDNTSTLTLTATGGTFFVADDVGREIHMTISGDNGYEANARVTVTGYTSSTIVTVVPIVQVPVDFRIVGTTTFSRAVISLAGLFHLEGEQVSAIGDAFVVASPNNASYVALTVANGAVTLDKHYAVIHIGLPFISDIETLDIDTANGETIADKNKIVNRVSMHVEDTRGLWVGGREPLVDPNVLIDRLEGLTEVKLREDEDYGSPVDLKTEVVDVIIEAEWNSNGRVFIRQVDPVPMSIGAIFPAGKYPLK